MEREEEWRTRMKPWQDELWGWARVSECHEHAPHLDKRFDRLLVTLEATHEERRAFKLREALELVTLWAFVDQDAWKEVVVSCGTPWDVYVSDRGSYLPPKYVIVLETRHWVNDYSEAQTQFNLSAIVSHLFGPLSLIQRTEEYRKTRKMLLNRVQDPVCRRQWENLTVDVVVRGRFDLASLYTTLHNELSSVYQRQQRANGQNEDCALSLEAMDLDFTTLELTAEQMVQLRKVLGTRDVPVRRTELNDEGKSTKDLILGPLAGPVYTSGAGGLELWLASECFDSQSCPSVFSAMAASSTLIKLDALVSPDVDEVSNREWLRWLAFAFFSRFSRSSIKNLVIRDSFSMENVTAIRDVVNTANPLSSLLESSESVCRVMELREDMLVAQSGARDVVSVCGGTTVWVVHDRRESTTIDVLVPGYGIKSEKKVRLVCQLTFRASYFKSRPMWKTCQQVLSLHSSKSLARI